MPAPYEVSRQLKTFERAELMNDSVKHAGRAFTKHVNFETTMSLPTCLPVPSHIPVPTPDALGHSPSIISSKPI